MSGPGLLFLLLVGGFVWGGFLLLVVRAVRREAGKSRAREGGEPGD